MSRLWSPLIFLFSFVGLAYTSDSRDVFIGVDAAMTGQSDVYYGEAAVLGSYISDMKNKTSTVFRLWAKRINSLMSGPRIFGGTVIASLTRLRHDRGVIAEFDVIAAWGVSNPKTFSVNEAEKLIKLFMITYNGTAGVYVMSVKFRGFKVVKFPILPTSPPPDFGLFYLECFTVINETFKNAYLHKSSSEFKNESDRLRTRFSYGFWRLEEYMALSLDILQLSPGKAGLVVVFNISIAYRPGFPFDRANLTNVGITALLHARFDVMHFGIRGEIVEVEGPSIFTTPPPTTPSIEDKILSDAEDVYTGTLTISGRYDSAMSDPTTNAFKNQSGMIREVLRKVSVRGARTSAFVFKMSPGSIKISFDLVFLWLEANHRQRFEDAFLKNAIINTFSNNSNLNLTLLSVAVESYRRVKFDLLPKSAPDDVKVYVVNYKVLLGDPIFDQLWDESSPAYRSKALLLRKHISYGFWRLSGFSASSLIFNNIGIGMDITITYSFDNFQSENRSLFRSVGLSALVFGRLSVKSIAVTSVSISGEQLPWYIYIIIVVVAVSLVVGTALLIAWIKIKKCKPSASEDIPNAVSYNPYAEEDRESCYSDIDKRSSAYSNISGNDTYDRDPYTWDPESKYTYLFPPDPDCPIAASEAPLPPERNEPVSKNFRESAHTSGVESGCEMDTTTEGVSAEPENAEESSKETEPENPKETPNSV